MIHKEARDETERQGRISMVWAWALLPLLLAAFATRNGMSGMTNREERAAYPKEKRDRWVEMLISNSWALRTLRSATSSPLLVFDAHSSCLSLCGGWILGASHFSFISLLSPSTLSAISQHACFPINRPHGLAVSAMKRSHSQRQSQPASIIVAKKKLFSAEINLPCTPPFKLRRQGSRLLSALKSITGQSNGTQSSSGVVFCPSGMARC